MGTERFRTTYTGTVEGSFTSLPFGDSQATASGSDTNPYHFAGLDSDATGLQHATFRDYSSTQARWLRPDPYDGSYNMGDPQSFNRYAYVENTPATEVDPDGTSNIVLPTLPDGGGTLPALLYASQIGNPGNDGVFMGWDTFAVLNIVEVYQRYIQKYGQWIPDEPELIPAGASVLDMSSTTLSSFANALYAAAPNNAEPPPPCQAKILNATNKQFGTNYTDANVSSTFNYSTGAGPGQGTLNLNITGSTAGVSPGYYPVHWYTYIIGYGPTLHVVSGPGGNGGLDSQMTVPFGPNQGTFHIDSGFPHNPLGALFHGLLNMTKLGGYPKC